MKKEIFLSLIFSVLISFSVTAQTLLSQVKPAGSKTWGYANSKGELIIPAKYEKCYKFSSEGLAPIYDVEKKQFYFINPKGETLPVEISNFRLIEGFGFGAELVGYSDGLVPVKIGEKWGYLNTQGKLSIPAKYERVTEFNNGYANVSADGKFLVLDTKGTETPVDAPGLVELKPFSEKYAAFRTADKKLGFIGVDGKVAVPAQFESVGYFSGGLAWAKDQSKKLGFINSKGEWVIKPLYTAGKEFDPISGLAMAKEGEVWVYVSKTGEVLRVTDADKYNSFSEGFAEARKVEKVGFLGPKGQWAIAPQFEDVRAFKNGFAAAKSNGKWGFINTKGEWTAQPQFDGIKDLELIK
ncbi:MAG: repeat-containing protein [Chitinophagaceae bacterium]|nr:repeat-containing protein [Chitinophagaceae bacterium]